MTPRKIAAVEGNQQAAGVNGPARFNPFALAIRRPLTEEEVIDEVARTPRVYEGECELSPYARRELVMRLDDFVEPLPRFFELENRISGMIRAGYARRNPLPLGLQRQLVEKQGLDQREFTTPAPITLAPGLSLIGFSDVGKTTAVSSVLSLHSQLHIHESFQGVPFHRTQLVWARVACPPSGGARTLLMNIFQEFDRLLGTDNHRRFDNSRRSGPELIPNLVDIMSTLGLGLLVIDEIQRLVRMGDEEASLLLDVFTHLRTEIHTPVMLIGTPKAMSVLNSGFEQGRRNTSLGHIDWQPMDNDDTWAFFVEQMWKLQWLSKPTPLTEKLQNALYEWSQGITDIAVKIFKMAQYTVIGADDENLTPELFEVVVRTEFAWFVPWIPYLKRRDPKLMSGEFDRLFEPNAKKGRRKSQVAAAPDLSNALLHAGVKPEELHDVLAGLRQRREAETAAAAGTPATSVKPAKAPNKKKAPAPAETASGLTLWELVQQQPHLSGHDALLEAGHVRLPGALGF